MLSVYAQMSLPTYSDVTNLWEQLQFEYPHSHYTRQQVQYCWDHCALDGETLPRMQRRGRVLKIFQVHSIMVNPPKPFEDTVQDIVERIWLPLERKQAARMPRYGYGFK